MPVKHGICVSVCLSVLCACVCVYVCVSVCLCVCLHVNNSNNPQNGPCMPMFEFTLSATTEQFLTYMSQFIDTLPCLVLAKSFLVFEAVFRTVSLNVICRFEGDFGTKRLERVF